MPVPLLRLPYLAVAEVIKMMVPIEVLFLTQTSQKACTLVRRQKVFINIHVLPYEDEMGVSFDYGDEEQNASIDILRDTQTDELRKSKSMKLKIEKSDDLHARTYWFDRIEGVKTVINFLIDTFSIESFTFTSCPETNTEDAVLLVDFVLKCQKKLEQLKIRKTDFILRLCDASWVTIGNLFEFVNCSKVLLHYPNLTDDDLRNFVNYWESYEGKIPSWALRTHRDVDMTEVLKNVYYETDEVAPGRRRWTWKVERADESFFRVDCYEGQFFLSEEN